MKSNEIIVNILEKRSEIMPNNIAYYSLDDTLRETQITYANLYKRVQSMASYLLSKGVKNNNRCMLLYYGQIDFIVAFLACNLMGAIPIPMNIPSKNKSIKKWEDIQKNTNVKYLLTEEKKRSTLEKIIEKSMILSQLPIYSEVQFDSTKLEGDFNEIVFLQFTSGTTGDPKGVMVTHSSLFNNLNQLKIKINLTYGDIILSWLPFYHDMGLIFGMLEGIYNGNTVVLIKPYDFIQRPLNWGKAIKKYQATHICGPNFAYGLLADRLHKATDKEAKEISFEFVKKLSVERRLSV